MRLIHLTLACTALSWLANSVFGQEAQYFAGRGDPPAQTLTVRDGSPGATTLVLLPKDKEQGPGQATQPPDFTVTFRKSDEVQAENRPVVSASASQAEPLSPTHNAPPAALMTPKPVPLAPSSGNVGPMYSSRALLHSGTDHGVVLPVSLLPQKTSASSAQVSPVVFAWPNAEGQKNDLLQPPPPGSPSQGIPPAPLALPSPTSRRATEAGVTYSKDGVTYSADGDGFLYVDAAPRQPVAAAPAPSSDDVRINWSCAAGRGQTCEIVAETLFWRLEHTRGQPVALNPVLGQTTRTDDLDPDFAVGPRVSARYMSDESENITGFEIGYFGIYDWDATRVLVAPAGTYLRLPDTLGNVGETVDFAQADSMGLYFKSRLNSVEASMRFGDPSAGFHMIFGPRYLRLEEEFRIDSYTAGRKSSYDVATRDSLWGIQLGGEWTCRRACWECNTSIKVGVYNNNARQATLMTDNDRTEVLRDFRVQETVNSFVLDAGLNVSRQINDLWLVRIGYNVLWLNHIARAPDQLDFSDSAVSGSLIFFRQDALAHGLNFGLEANW